MPLSDLAAALAAATGPSREQIICAIDRPDVPGAAALAYSLVDAVGVIKLGLEFFSANGPDGVDAVRHVGLPVFLDLKLHDIPRTVARAVKAIAKVEPAMLTVHALGGRDMLKAAADAAWSLYRGPRLLGVTVLTSLPSEGVLDHVIRLAEDCVTAGIDGVVCSAHETAELRRRFGDDLTLVVPGIRGAGESKDDQQRTATAAEAIATGADYIVVGRPITAAANPRLAAVRLALAEEGR